jgi:fructose-bisphosphate aldolase class II
LRLLWTRIHREFFKNSPELFDPIVPGKFYMKEFEKFMISKFELLGACGKADKFI